jgi:hypothetical protein
MAIVGLIKNALAGCAATMREKEWAERGSCKKRERAIILRLQLGDGYEES